jgi:glutamine amidotransferase
MRHHPVKSRTVIAHIRKATQGRVALSNCHPFTRRLWGRDWVFAHNGDLKKLALKLDGRYRPQGSTDSELAFCYMLQELQRRCGPARPALAVLLAEIAQLNAELSCHGPFNYLLADGQDLFAHCSTSLHHVARAHPFRAVRLLDHDLGVDLAQLNRADERMTVITTRPLTSGEDWVAFRPGELKHFRDGLEASLRPVSAPLQPA